VAIVWTVPIGQAEILAWTSRVFGLPPVQIGGPRSPLQEALIACLSILDQGWVILAALNAYSFTAAAEGLGTARRWGLLTLLVVVVVAGCSKATGWPLGPVFYTNLLGARIRGVPYGMPLLWFSAIIGARALMLQIQPSLSQIRLAFGTGALALFFDFALEPVAWKMRVFWMWYVEQPAPHPSWPPLQNYLTWFGVAAVLAFFMRETRVARRDWGGLRSPAGVFMALFAVFTAANVARVIHNRQ
jgi:uncharacterized membrane protein